MKMRIRKKNRSTIRTINNHTETNRLRKTFSHPIKILLLYLYTIKSNGSIDF